MDRERAPKQKPRSATSQRSVSGGTPPQNPPRGQDYRGKARQPASSRTRSRPEYYQQPRRDPFLMLMSGVIGALVVGIIALLIIFFSVSRPNSTLGGAPPVSNPIASPANPAVGGQVNPATLPVGGNPVSSASGPGTAVPDQGKNHAPDGQQLTYNPYPPSSGTHYGVTADYGFHDTQVPDGQLVHNLEHGAVILYYKPGASSDVIQQLKDAYTNFPPGKYGKVKMVVTPSAQLTQPFAMTAWTRLEYFSTLDINAMRAFYQAWVDKGPEDVP